MPVALEIMTKPTIHILSASNAPDRALQQLQYGMEEEGVPWENGTRPGADALALAWEAAQASRLGVGVGLDAQSVVLHFSKLEPGQPLFQISAQSDAEQMRAVGANAARLIKKLPLKPLDRR